MKFKKIKTLPEFIQWNKTFLGNLQILFKGIYKYCQRDIQNIVLFPFIEWIELFNLFKEI